METHRAVHSLVEVCHVVTVQCILSIGYMSFVNIWLVKLSTGRQEQAIGTAMAVVGWHTKQNKYPALAISHTK